MMGIGFIQVCLSVFGKGQGERMGGGAHLTGIEGPDLKEANSMKF